MTDDSTGIDLSIAPNTVAKLESLSRRILTGAPFIFVFAGRGINREQKSFPLAINSDSRSTRMLEKSAVLLANGERNSIRDLGQPDADHHRMPVEVILAVDEGIRTMR